MRDAMKRTRCAICRDPMPAVRANRVYARCADCDEVVRRIGESHTVPDPLTPAQEIEERERRMTCRVAEH